MTDPTYMRRAAGVIALRLLAAKQNQTLDAIDVRAVRLAVRGYTAADDITRRDIDTLAALTLRKIEEERAYAQQRQHDRQATRANDNSVSSVE